MGQFSSKKCLRRTLMAVAVLTVYVTIYVLTFTYFPSPTSHPLRTEVNSDHPLVSPAANQTIRSIVAERKVSPKPTFMKGKKKDLYHKIDIVRSKALRYSQTLLEAYTTIKSASAKQQTTTSQSFCPPLPLQFPTDVSFFPCQWDVKKVVCATRLRASVVCNLIASPTIIFEQVSRNEAPQRVPFKSACLHHVISTRCYDDGLRVPRVLHYVTGGGKEQAEGGGEEEEEMSLVWFLSVLSAVRFLQPCLVLFHGDRLPLGRHWEALLQLVPHVLHVTGHEVTTSDLQGVGEGRRLGDVLGMEVVREYGGVYLHPGHWLLTSVDDLRQQLVTLLTDVSGNDVSNIMILGERGATFLNRWHESALNQSSRSTVTPNNQPSGGFLPDQLALMYPDEGRILEPYSGYTFKAEPPAIGGDLDGFINRGGHLFQETRPKERRREMERQAEGVDVTSRRVLFGSSLTCDPQSTSDPDLDPDPDPGYVRARVHWRSPRLPLPSP